MGHSLCVLAAGLLVGQAEEIVSQPARPGCNCNASTTQARSRNQSTWTQTTAAAAFPARGLFTLFVHNNEMWLAGGLAAGPLNDVWRSSDGAAWRVGLSLPITAPP